MTLQRLWLYTARCAAAGCRREQTIYSNGTEQPTPAAWARGNLRGDGWTIVSRGNRLGWDAYCPDHPRCTYGRRAAG